MDFNILSQNKTITCPVLTYTSVIPRDEGDINFCTTARKFETDIETLHANGFTPISLREAYECHTVDKSHIKPVCIVFLDGIKNIRKTRGENVDLLFIYLRRLFRK